MRGAHEKPQREEPAAAIHISEFHTWCLSRTIAHCNFFREKQMANQDLQGLKVAILVTDGFEQVELTEPRKALDKGGAETRVVSPKQGRVRGWKFTERGDDIPVDVTLDQTRPDEFDALLLPRWSYTLER
jgi:hypothetical protein